MDANKYNVFALAYLGDAIYEVAVRKYVLEHIKSSRADLMHKMGIGFVCAGAQAKAVKTMLDEKFFTEEEEALLRRARNHKIATKPKNADVMEYKWATAFEALIGWLNLKENLQRQEQVIDRAIEILKK